MIIKKGQTKGILRVMDALIKEMEEVKILDTTLKYRIMKNVQLLSPEVSILEKINPELVWVDHEKERVGKLNEICEKDDEGNPVFIKEEGKQDRYSIPEDAQEDFEKYLDELKVKYDPMFEKAIEEFNKIANEEIDLNLRKLNLKSLEGLDLKAEDIGLVIELIDEEDM